MTTLAGPTCGHFPGPNGFTMLHDIAGKWDDLTALLGEKVSKERSLSVITWLMGDNRFKYERKLKEKMKGKQDGPGKVA